MISFTAHFKYHGSFDHEHSLPLVGLGLITLIELKVLNNKKGKIKKTNLSFLYLYVVVYYHGVFFFYVIVITIHGNTKCM